MRVKGVMRVVPVARVVRSWSGRLALQLVLPVALVALWWWTSEDSGSVFYPPLSEIIESLQDDWLFEQVGSDLLPSLGRFTVGYLIAVVAGIALGTLIGLAPRVRLASQPVVEFLRSIPPPLMLPFALVVIGIGNDSKIALIAIGSVWPVLLNTIDGVRGVDSQTLDMARSFDVGRRMQVTRVVLPAASPKIAVGMRTALSIGLILMIISEMQASSNGLGFQVLNAQRSFDAAGTYAGVIVIGVVGLVVNFGFLVAERRIMAWHRGARGLLDDDASTRQRRRRPAPGAAAQEVPVVSGLGFGG
jgi:ABC-type nitrate/sulfonate/bicarbonate transport system permease component